MSERALAAASYLPVPGLAYLFPYARPGSRLVRFHSRQGGLVWLVTFPLVTLTGLAAGDGPLPQALTMASGLWLGLALGASMWEALQAARGRFTRLRPVWDLQALMGGGNAERRRPA